MGFVWGAWVCERVHLYCVCVFKYARVWLRLPLYPGAEGSGGRGGDKVLWLFGFYVALLNRIKLVCVCVCVCFCLCVRARGR